MDYAEIHSSSFCQKTLRDRFLIMRKFGLIGYPLGHSFSKKYFTEKFHNEHIKECSYELFPIENIGHLPVLIEAEPELSGLNVTIPYKSEVISFLDMISPEAEEIGAVNVIKIVRNQKKTFLSGFNSDVTGFRDSLSPHLRSEIKSAIIFGSGGSSKAVCYVLARMGMDLTIVSREKKPGTITYSDLVPELLSNTYLIVNTTPLGMFPNVESYPDINYELLGKKHILFDLVYNPEETVFLRKGKERGSKVISGLQMLHLQAEKAWDIWNM